MPEEQQKHPARVSRRGLFTLTAQSDQFDLSALVNEIAGQVDGTELAERVVTGAVEYILEERSNRRGFLGNVALRVLGGKPGQLITDTQDKIGLARRLVDKQRER